MTNSRKTKWDWATHFPRMADLYRRGQTISKIHKTVQTDTFRPCQRAVYNRFNFESLSNEPGRSFDSLDVESPTGTEERGVVTGLQSSPLSKSEEAIPKDGEHTAVVEHDIVIVASSPLNGDNTSAISQESGHNGAHSPKILLPASENAESDLLNASTSPNWTSCVERDAVEDTALGTSASTGVLPEIDVSEEGQTGRNHKRKKRDKLSAIERNNQVIQNLAAFGLIGTQHGGGRTRHPYRLKEPSRLKTPLGQMCSTKYDKKGSTFEARSYQNSLFGDNDSGYHSGRGTPSTFSLVSRPESLTEFLGLHRVACHALHEPKYPEKYRETQPCHVCGCSRIHILAWSANYLKLHEFDAELKSMDRQDVQALDAAGNSGLHYAATSGVGYAHLKALINEGVPVDARNTASQNFLHCLRPCDAGAEICTVDCFTLGLLKLLELVKLRMDFGQQDNDGQTILHVLASYITEPEVRDKTFKLFREHGCSWTILNRFGKSPKDIRPPDYAFGQTMYATETLTTRTTPLPDLESSAMSEWHQNDIKNMNSYNILVEAHQNPHYVDSTTKDSILHALSRVSRQSRGVMQKNDIIQDLKKFVTKGVNLNRHNRDGHSPLTAFICNQDLRGNETGATMAKYIDILLWKGGKHGVLNDINVNMMNRKGATAIYEAAVQAQSDTVRSLIEAGANVNARLSNDPKGLSVLQATVVARNQAVQNNDHVLHDRFKNVISHLELAGAVAYPSSFQERGWSQESCIAADLLQ